MLSEVGLVLNGEVRDVFFHRGSKLLWRKTNACEVVDTATEFCVVCIQEINGGLNAVINVDHWKEGLGLEEALVVTVLKGFKKDFYPEIKTY